VVGVEKYDARNPRRVHFQARVTLLCNIFRHCGGSLKSMPRLLKAVRKGKGKAWDGGAKIKPIGNRQKRYI
jgi:hypothetical protein